MPMMYRRLLSAAAEVDVNRPARLLAGAVLLLVALAAAWPAAAQSPPLPPDQCYRLSLPEALPWGVPGIDSAADDTLRVVTTLERILELADQGLSVAVAGLPPSLAPLVQVSFELGRTVQQFGETQSGEWLDVAFQRNPESEESATVLADWPPEHQQPGTAPGTTNLGEARSRPCETQDRRLVLDTFLGHLERSLESLQLVPQVDERVMHDGSTLTAVFGRSPMSAGTLAFGDLRTSGDGETRSAFLYYDDFGQEQVFDYLPADAPVRNFYLRTSSYLAALGEVGFVLLVDEEPAIAEVRRGVKGLRTLPSFSGEFGRRPNFEQLPAWESRKATAVYELLEGTRMPVGLYGRGEYLHLLVKEAMADDGETAWWLIKLDPREGGKELTRVLLPSSAAHLTVVPGGFWTIIEVGPVQGIGDRHAAFLETASAILIPAAWLENPRQHKATAQMSCVDLTG